MICPRVQALLPIYKPAVFIYLDSLTKLIQWGKEIPDKFYGLQL